MPSEILAVAATVGQTSSDVVVAAGAELTVAIKDVEGPEVKSGARVDVLLKDDDGVYFKVDELKPSRPVLVLSAGTWQFKRVADIACGVFSG